MLSADASCVIELQYSLDLPDAGEVLKLVSNLMFQQIELTDLPAVEH